MTYHPRMRGLSLVVVVALCAPALADRGPLVQPFVSVDAATVVLINARVIDGTGAAPKERQTILVRDGRIVTVTPNKIPVPARAKIIDVAGKTVLPGLVGMHEHLFYPPKIVLGPTMFTESFYVPQPYSFPRLYLAAGVTTARTAGSMSPYLDLAIKRQIEDGVIPGPRLDVTGPYIEGPKPMMPQMPAQADAAGVRRLVDYWAAEGVTSFKLYNVVTREQLAAAIDAAHAHHLKVAGHLCSVGFHDAAAAGIDSLEHGLIVDTEFFDGKKPDQCPQGALAMLPDPATPEVQALIGDLVAHHVAIDSTLAVFEAFAGRPMDARTLPMLDGAVAKSVTAAHAAFGRMGPLLGAPVFKKELAFERAFVKAGGLLLSGCDPTGDGSVLAGFGDQRNLEILVEAGFTPLEAIHIATQNGATFLGRDDVGTIAPGKRADLVVVDGNPARDIHDIEKVETVFKDGVGYDSKKLIDAVRGNVGLR